LSVPVWKAKAVWNFTDDLCDGSVILSVIKAHAPFIDCKVIYKPENEQEKLRNARAIVKAVKDLGFESILLDTEIVNPDPRSMLLFVYTLFNILPGCVPSKSPQVFFFVLFCFVFLFCFICLLLFYDLSFFVYIFLYTFMFKYIQTLKRSS
jgi:hypothetical protein